MTFNLMNFTLTLVSYYNIKISATKIAIICGNIIRFKENRIESEFKKTRIMISVIQFFFLIIYLIYFFYFDQILMIFRLIIIKVHSNSKKINWKD